MRYDAQSHPNYFSVNAYVLLFVFRQTFSKNLGFPKNRVKLKACNFEKFDLRSIFITTYLPKVFRGLYVGISENIFRSISSVYTHFWTAFIFNKITYGAIHKWRPPKNLKILTPHPCSLVEICLKCESPLQ